MERDQNHCVGRAMGRVRALTWPMIFALLLGASTAHVVCAQDHLGSVNDYLNSNPDFPDADEFPLLGIAVTNASSTLKGQQFEGAEIVDVVPGSPAAVAGLKGRQQRVQMLMTVTIVAASMLFPPAMLGALALSSSGIGESREFIIAVDGTRVHNIIEFGGALNQAQPGEIFYFTVVINGERKQSRIVLPGRGASESYGSDSNG